MFVGVLTFGLVLLYKYGVRRTMFETEQQLGRLLALLLSYGCSRIEAY